MKLICKNEDANNIIYNKKYFIIGKIYTSSKYNGINNCYLININNNIIEVPAQYFEIVPDFKNYRFNLN